MKLLGPRDELRLLTMFSHVSNANILFSDTGTRRSPLSKQFENCSFYFFPSCMHISVKVKHFVQIIFHLMHDTLTCS